MAESQSYYASPLLENGGNQLEAASHSDESEESEGDGPIKKRKRPMNVT